MGRGCWEEEVERGPRERYGRAKPETAWMSMSGASGEAGVP